MSESILNPDETDKNRRDALANLLHMARDHIRDFSEWKAYITPLAERAASDAARNGRELRAHIQAEEAQQVIIDRLSQAHAELSSVVTKHNKEAEEHWIPVLRQFEQHRNDMIELLSFTDRAGRFLDVICILAKWGKRLIVFGGGTIIGLAAVYEAARKLGWL